MRPEVAQQKPFTDDDNSRTPKLWLEPRCRLRLRRQRLTSQHYYHHHYGYYPHHQHFYAYYPYHHCHHFWHRWHHWY
jgi:hypothetical protein